MSKKGFKVQASSSRATSGLGFGGFGSTSTASSLSYIAEPPDLTTISDGNVVVAFKGLLKKDETTKARALEDLLEYTQAHPHSQGGGVEDGILEAWVKVYPRVSIDNSRRVRELSHKLQHELLTSTRKRMERHMPKLVGAWLAGIYDRDSSVSRAATSGIEAFLDNDNKIRAFWRVCQHHILEFVQQALGENAQTLSDERTVSPDDAEAKYNRVISASLALLLNLLQILSVDDVKKEEEKYTDILDNPKIWSSVSSSDSMVRRSCANLVRMLLERHRDLILSHIDTIGKSFIQEGLRANHTGSALVFTQALVSLTRHFPEIWTTTHKGSKSPFSRLRRFVQKGSFGGPPEYWRQLTELILSLPPGILPADANGATEFLAAVREGVSNRGERSNVLFGWTGYFDIAAHLSRNLLDVAAKTQFLESSVYPFFEQYIRPVPENASWSSGNDIRPLRQAFRLSSSVDETNESLKAEWQKIKGLLVESIQMSQPEQAKDYTKSQDLVASEGQRWASLQAEAMRSSSENEAAAKILDVILPPTVVLLRTALDVLARRNGKPYGAAAVVHATLASIPTLIQASDEMVHVIPAFLKEKLPELITSPSSRQLISSLHAFAKFPGQDDEYRSTWNSVTGRFLSLPDARERWITVQALISDEKAKSLAHGIESLQEYLLEIILATSRGEMESWTLLDNVLIFDSMTHATSNLLIDGLIAGLDGAQVNGSIRILEVILRKRPELVHNKSGAKIAILTKLLALTELADSSQVPRALTLKKALEAAEGNSEAASGTDSPILQIIQENLRSAGPYSLTIDTLFDQASTILREVGLAKLLPEGKAWQTTLDLILAHPTTPAVCITNPLHGALAFVAFEAPSLTAKVPKDADGLTAPLRMAMYTTKLLSPRMNSLELSTDEQVDLLYNLSLTIEVSNDQLSLHQNGPLWNSAEDDELESEIESSIYSAQRLVSTILGNSRDWSAEEPTSVSSKFVRKLLQKSEGDSPESFYAARTLSGTLSTLVETHGWQNSRSEEWLTKLQLLLPSTVNIMAATAVLTGLKESLVGSKVVSNLCNRLVSEIPGAVVTTPKTLSFLIMMNACLDIYEKGELPVAQNRLVFAVRQICSWLDADEYPPAPVVFEACRALAKLFPAIRQIYGSHWEIASKFCARVWGVNGSGHFDSRLPEIYATLKLVSVLEALSREGDEDEQNGDLLDALANVQDLLREGLVNLLRIPREGESQPVSTVDQLLYRRAKALSFKGLDLSEIYPLLASNSKLVQLSAFNILHRAIPVLQQDISVEAALDKRDARLPKELLSLLLDVPSSQSLSQKSEFPAALRGYLLSLHLIFDNYINASYKVRADYTDNLKSGDYIPPFLDLLTELLGHTAGRPLVISRASLDNSNVIAYDADMAETEPDQRNMQWLLVHLYYLCLTRTPQIVKGWWLDLPSKQTRIAVESWTETTFSPLVISEIVREVQDWSEAQETPANDDEKELIIKVSPKAREISAGYEVDETQMKILIRLPSAFPLSGVKVESLNRVAISESKWQSWLMITQGVITFSNSIIDGLVVFRKNVIGALKGHTECAICYSLVSHDRKVPDKRCQTCKNLFHGSCLFKWFDSSNQSTCPLCRNPFQYGGLANPGRRRGGLD